MKDTGFPCFLIIELFLKTHTCLGGDMNSSSAVAI